jgi:hypothetical protein
MCSYYSLLIVYTSTNFIFEVQERYRPIAKMGAAELKSSIAEEWSAFRLWYIDKNDSL